MEMKTGFISKLIFLAAVSLISSLAVALSSCDRLQEDLPECDRGLRLRFVYDYNMEYANAFPSQVTCLTVLVYDVGGKYLETLTVTDPGLLSDEFWRMTVDLPEGKYRLLAYGGMACDERSFHFVTPPAPGTLLDAHTVAMNGDIVEGNGRTRLHHLFYGALDVEVENSDTGYRDYTLRMMKDTNDIRIVLQHLNGEPVDPDKFNFCVTADNTLMAADNSLIETGTTVFEPWEKGTTAMGILPDGTTVGNAYAQISTCRLVAKPGANPRIRVTRAGTDTGSDTRADAATPDDTVLDLDLIWLVSLARQQNNVDEMRLEEYLDRESRWSFIFLLDENDVYYQLHLKVNDWEVRINNIEG
jgi:hypothetical protein